MNKLIPVSLLLLAIVSCNAAKPAPQSNEALQKKADSLATELSNVKQVLTYIVEKGMGKSYDQIKQEIENESRVWDIPLDDSPVLGNPNAPITIVEFSEFQCPYCNRITPYLDSIMRTYPDKIKLVYKNFPLSFHQDAPAAAAAALAAKAQGKFWEYRWVLAPHFQSLNDSTFIAVAQQVGLDIEKFKKDMVLDSAKQAIIDRDMQLGVKIGVQGTPNFYINGKRQDRFGPAVLDQMIKDLK